jgi:hypothetical protein
MGQTVQPQRLQRRAQRLGFGEPTLREAGLGRYSLEFHLPDKPPTTLSRPIASAIVLEPPEQGMEPDPLCEYTVGEIAIRYPQAPEHRFDSDTAVEAGEAAWDAASLSGSGRVRLNLVVENQHAIHYDIDRNEDLAIDMAAFLEKVYEAGERFNRVLSDAV